MESPVELLKVIYHELISKIPWLRERIEQELYTLDLPLHRTLEEKDPKLADETLRIITRNLLEIAIAFQAASRSLQLIRDKISGEVEVLCVIDERGQWAMQIGMKPAEKIVSIEEAKQIALSIWKFIETCGLKKYAKEFLGGLEDVAEKGKFEAD